MRNSASPAEVGSVLFAASRLPPEPDLMTDRLHCLGRLLSWGLCACTLTFTVAGIGCGSLYRRADTKAVRTSVTPVERGQVQLAGPASKPGRYTTRVGLYAFHTDFPIDTTDPLFRELEDLPDQIESELRLPTGTNVIRVHLFDNEDKYHAFLRAKDPKLPLRSAYFFAEPTRSAGQSPDLNVYTWTGPRLKTDLRHELTHALLHGTLKGVPLWLDEGLAGFFEQPVLNDGVNLLHLDALRTYEPLRQGPFRGDMARLEKLSQVNQMGRPEYQEAWAWVHFMLRGEPKARQVLLDHLQILRSTSNPGLLLPKLEAVTGDPAPQLLAYLTKLELPNPSRLRQAGN
jgi:hypothetical protein